LSVDARVTAPAGDGGRTDEPSDESLVVAARSGDRAAFACLYDRYARVVHGVLLTRVSPPDADDLVQDVFLKALRALGTLRDAGAVGPWLLAAARNRAASFQRGWWSRRVLRLTTDPAAPANSTGLDATEVLAAIKALPEAYRETMVLRLVEGLTGPEIAARTGMTHGSVRVNLTRGMKQLRQKLGLEDEP
jgi:RNA polymerase sigma-70 factor (ECF subfamily)